GDDREGKRRPPGRGTRRGGRLARRSRPRHRPEGARMTSDGTRVVRAGLPEPAAHEPSLPGPVFAAHFHLPGDVTGPYTYGRDGNPTWSLLEEAIGELESPEQPAHTVAFASGM